MGKVYDKMLSSAQNYIKNDKIQSNITNTLTDEESKRMPGQILYYWENKPVRVCMTMKLEISIMNDADLGVH